MAPGGLQESLLHVEWYCPRSAGPRLILAGTCGLSPIINKKPRVSAPSHISSEPVSHLPVPVFQHASNDILDRNDAATIYSAVYLLLGRSSAGLLCGRS